MTDREVMQMLLDYLVDIGLGEKPIAKALRDRLAWPEQNVSYTGNGTAGRENMTAPTGYFFQMPKSEPEPVAWHEPGAYGNVTTHKDWALANGWLPLYAAPREWVGLTEEEVLEEEEFINHRYGKHINHTTAILMEFVKQIEDSFRRKNT